MKRPLLFMFLCVIILFAGCVFDGDDKDDGEFDTKSYLPVTPEGSSVTWRMTVTDIDSGTTTTSDYTELISKHGGYDGHTVYRLSTNISGSEPARFYSDSNSLWFFIDEHFFDGLIYGSTEKTPLGYPYPLFDFSANRNVRHTLFEGGTTTDDLFVNFNLYSTLAGAEEVTVPLGTFADCPNFQLSYEVIHTPRIQGDTFHYKRFERHWFGKKYGPVKRVFEYYRGGVLFRRVVQEAVSYQAVTDNN